MRRAKLGQPAHDGLVADAVKIKHLPFTHGRVG